MTGVAGFLLQAALGAALFALIEGGEGWMRRRWPGRGRGFYYPWKIAVGLPAVVLAGAAVMAPGGQIDLAAALTGVVAAALVALVFFRGPPDPETPSDRRSGR